MEVAGLNDGPDTGHLSEYGGRDDEDAAPREHDTAVLKNYLRQNFEKAKFETGKLRNHYPPPLCIKLSKRAEGPGGGLGAHRKRKP